MKANCVFVMEHCGCRLTREELLITSKKHRTLSCPHHNDNKVDHIEKECASIDCSEIIHLNTKQHATAFCGFCKKTGRAKAAENRWDCLYRNGCMTKTLRDKPSAKFLPCYGCPDYRKDKDKTYLKHPLDEGSLEQHG